MTIKKMAGNFLMVSALAGFGLGLGMGTASGADKKTERLWKAKCASCHDKDGTGQTEQGKKMAVGDMTKAAYWKNSDADLKKAVADGLKQKSKDGKDQEMKPFKDKLKAEEIDALIEFAKQFKK